MSPELLERIARITAIAALESDEERAAAFAELNLTDEELAQLDADMIAAAQAVDLTNPSDEDLALLDSVDSGTQTVRAEVERRETAAAERRTAAEERLSRIAPADETPAPAEGGEPAADGEPAPDAEPAADPADTPPAGDAEPATPAAEATPEPEAVPVAAAAPVRRPSLPAVAARRPQSMAPRMVRDPNAMHQTVTAAAELPNLPAGARINDDLTLARAIVDRADALRGVDSSPRLRVATVHSEYPEDRRLSDSDAVLNEQRIDGVAGREAIAAAGGLCAPLTPDYDVPVISDATRVVPNALARFQAARGGVRWVPPPVLGDYDAGATTAWTVANDIALTDPATKPCVRVDCAPEETVELEAFPVCLTVGNFYAMTYDERVQAILKLLAATGARFTESRLLTKIGAGSTQVTTGQHLGAVRDYIASTTLAVAKFKNRHRMAQGARLRTLLPDWIHELFRADLARQIPGDDELDTTDAEIDGWIRQCGVEPTFFLDGEAGQIFGAQDDGPLGGWPSTVIGYIFPEGTWLYIERGDLNLGVVRDSTLNATNDLQIWSESFENVALRGIESWRMAYDLCPSGWTSAPVDVDPCSVGS